jgi:hypothetical protein
METRPSITHVLNLPACVVVSRGPDIRDSHDWQSNRLMNAPRSSLSGAAEAPLSRKRSIRKFEMQNAQLKLIADISAMFGVIVLFLAAIGIYAVFLIMSLD